MALGRLRGTGGPREFLAEMRDRERTLKRKTPQKRWLTKNCRDQQY